MKGTTASESTMNSWQSILITLAAGIVLSATSCYGFVSTFQSGNFLTLLCAIFFFAGVITILATLVYAVVRIFRSL